jgi:hypothetical protein
LTSEEAENHPLLKFFQSLARREQPSSDLNPCLLFAPDSLKTYHYVMETISACRKDAARMSADHFRILHQQLTLSSQ